METTTATMKSSSLATTKAIISTETTDNAKPSLSSSTTTKEKKEEKMDYSVNLKRRRDSGDSQVEEGEETFQETSPRFTNSSFNTCTATTKRKKKKIAGSNSATHPNHSSKNPKIPQLISMNLHCPPTSPSLSLISTPKVLSQAHSVARDSTPRTKSPTKHHARSASNDVRRALNRFYFCQDIMESPNINHILKKTLKLLRSLTKIDNNKDITNPYLFRGAQMVTTFVCSPGNWTKALWQFIEEANRTDIRLVELEHPSLNVLSNKCTGRVPIYVHPCFYRSLKLQYPLDVGGISRDGLVTTKLGSGSLHQTVGILTLEDFWPVVDSE